MKTKKSIYTICLTLILLLSSVLLFACGNTTKSKDVYTSYNELLEELKGDSDLFSSKSINGISTDFYLNDFYSKDKNGSRVTDYDYYIQLASVSFDFIEKYHVVFNSFDVKYDFSNLSSDIKEVRDEYKKLKEEHQALVTSTVGLDYVIYNGYFSRYKAQTINFINSSFECALSMGEYIDKKEILVIAQESYNFDIDYELLKVFDDYRYFFLSSSKGVKISDDTFADTLSVFDNWHSQFMDKDYSLPAEEEIAKLETVFTQIEGDRCLARTAMKKFSYYQFVEEYEGSINAYSKLNENAEAYFNCIDDYLFSGTILRLKDYLTANLTA